MGDNILELSYVPPTKLVDGTIQQTLVSSEAHNSTSFGTLRINEQSMAF
jgi:hypothetical protein